MKLSNEMKQVPNWFTGCSTEKLFKHPVQSIQWLIYALYFGAFLTMITTLWALSSLFTAAAGLNAATGGTGISEYSLLSASLTPTLMFGVRTLSVFIIVLGIQYRSKLAYLLIFSTAVTALFMPMGFLLSGVIMYLLNRDEVVSYFFPESGAVATEVREKDAA